MEETNKISLQDAFLDMLSKERIPLSIYLSNGIRLVGNIEAFDTQIVLLKGDNNLLQAVYKQAISTILPSRTVNLPFDNPAPSVTVKKRASRRLTPFADAEM